MRGREQIADSAARSVGPGATVIHHLFSDEIDVYSSDSASGIWAMEDLVIRPEGPRAGRAPCMASVRLSSTGSTTPRRECWRGS
ncbi:nuclear transport factor 2 family protein [Streptomyces sp. NPDC102274]|uniref:nuclear transport factor 2 family protein n=1 Tax=Streptomyces sp. NPDC102274 TaxID=3366151 RepID=UPI0037F86A9B